MIPKQRSVTSAANKSKAKHKPHNPWSGVTLDDLKQVDTAEQLHRLPPGTALFSQEQEMGNRFLTTVHSNLSVAHWQNMLDKFQRVKWYVCKDVPLHPFNPSS